MHSRVKPKSHFALHGIANTVWMDAAEQGDFISLHWIMGILQRPLKTFRDISKFFRPCQNLQKCDNDMQQRLSKALEDGMVVFKGLQMSSNG